VSARVALVLAAIVAGMAAAPARAAGPPSTMRVDYFHTGGQGVDLYSLDRIVIEPLPWPGSLERAVDETNLGTYRFEVRDTAGRLLYSRGFDTVYAEWATTSEAGTAHRTFGDSLRFPAPSGPVKVVLKARNADQAFETVWQVDVDPAAVPEPAEGDAAAPRSRCAGGSWGHRVKS